MPFLGPWFLMGLLGVAGVAIPVVLHLFFRSRYRVVHWAAMEYLLKSIEQTSRRLKFQELLLLLLRCAVLVMLALALARPTLSLFTGGRDAVDAVFVIDNSMSMGAREGAKTRFELAKASALAAIDQLPPHSTVQIITCANAASDPLLQEPGNLDQARKVIEGLELTHLATDLGPGLTRAAALLKQSQASNKELYVFSDLQRQGLAQNGSEVNAALADARQVAAVYLVRCGSRKLGNAAITAVVPQTSIPRPGQRIGFSVMVHCTGGAPVQQLRVSLAVDGNAEEAESQTIPELRPGESRPVTLSARFEKPGLRVLTAFLSTDDLPGDNYYDQVIEVRDKVKILVVDGNLNRAYPDKSSSFFLVNALVPVRPEERAGYHVQAEVVSPAEAGGQLLQDKAVCILVNCPLGHAAPQDVLSNEFLDSLGQFVRKGHGLIVYGGERVETDDYNSVLGERGLLPVPLAGTRSYPVEAPLTFDRTSAGAPAFRRFAEDDYYKELANIPVYTTVGLNEPAAGAKGAKDADVARVIFRYHDGQPAMVARKVGAGEVLFIGTSPDPGTKPKSLEATWNYLHLWPGYVPLCEAGVNHLLSGQAQSHNLTAGEVLRYFPPDEAANRSFLLVLPGERKDGAPHLLTDGKKVPLGSAVDAGGRKLVTASGLARAGVYRLTTRENDAEDSRPFAVTADVRESLDLDSLSEAEIDAQVGFTPLHVAVKEGETPEFAAARTNREWTVYLLWLVLGLAVSESLLAWFCGRAW
jgi:hypothetical protein